MNDAEFSQFSAAHGGTPRPFDAWTFRDGDVEPCGSHASIAAALGTLAAEPLGGGVFVGRRLERWRDGTPLETRAAVLAALTGERVDNDVLLAPSETDDEPAAPPARVWSSHQRRVFDAVANGTTHLVVIARAGSGKTTTIVEALKLLPRGARAILVAYNKAIAEELRTRAPGGVDVQTSHAYGFRLLRAQWGKHLAPSEPDGKRLRGITDRIVPADIEKTDRVTVMSIVKWAKFFLAETDAELDEIVRARGLGIDWTVYADIDTDKLRYTDADLFRWVREILAATRLRDGVVDFDDMVYVPAALGMRGGYGFVFIDEAQDWNRAQVRLARCALAQGGRIVAVGDDRQAINGFRGADPEALPRLIEDLRGSPRGVEVLSLPVTYRCPRRVADLAREMVPDLETPATAAEGEVVDRVPEEFMSRRWGAGDFVISRVNAPLVKHCLAALKDGVRARIQGRDIGKDLARVLDKSRARTTAEFLAWLTHWAEERRAKLVSDEREDLIEQLNDQCAVLRTLAEATQSVEDIRAQLAALFVDEGEGQVVFTSAHRAKGLESDRVWLLRETFLRKRKDQPPSIEEENLFYVAVTRARRALYIVGGAASARGEAA